MNSGRDLVADIAAGLAENGLILRGMDRTIVPELVQGGGVREVVCFVPNGEQKFEAIVVPSEKAVTGDYVFTVRANGDGVSESVSFRSTVSTSTLWGAIGLGVIAASLLVLFGAFGRFGRR